MPVSLRNDFTGRNKKNFFIEIEKTIKLADVLSQFFVTTASNINCSWQKNLSMKGSFFNHDLSSFQRVCHSEACHQQSRLITSAHIKSLGS